MNYKQFYTPFIIFFSTTTLISMNGLLERHFSETTKLLQPSTHISDYHAISINTTPNLLALNPDAWFKIGTFLDGDDEAQKFIFQHVRAKPEHICPLVKRYVETCITKKSMPDAIKFFLSNSADPITNNRKELLLQYAQSHIIFTALQHISQKDEISFAQYLQQEFSKIQPTDVADKTLNLAVINYLDDSLKKNRINYCITATSAFVSGVTGAFFGIYALAFMMTAGQGEMDLKTSWPMIPLGASCLISGGIYIKWGTSHLKIKRMISNVGSYRIQFNTPEKPLPINNDS